MLKMKQASDDRFTVQYDYDDWNIGFIMQIAPIKKWASVNQRTELKACFL